MSMKGAISKNAGRWIILAGISLLLVSILLLGYALLPGGSSIRVQSTLSPTLWMVP